MLQLSGNLRSACQCNIIFITTGENDVTVILKSEAGGRRWQHFARNGDDALNRGGNGPQHPADAQQQRTESNYTVILGSHRNSCIKVEKDGRLCDRVGLQQAPAV